MERALGKMVTDEAFRREFASNPARASIETGLDLLPEELDALRRGPHDMLDRLASCLDGRAASPSRTGRSLRDDARPPHPAGNTRGR